MKRKDNIRPCRSMGGIPCVHPHLKCSACPENNDNRRYTLEKEDKIASIVSRIPDPVPYVSLKGPYGELAIELGIKGSF